MFKVKLHALVEEANWIVKCGRTLEGYRDRNTSMLTDVDAIYNADIEALQGFARAVVAAGRRSGKPARKEVARLIDNILTDGGTDALINALAGGYWDYTGL